MTLFQDFLQQIVTSETRSVRFLTLYLFGVLLTALKVAYTDCSTTNGVLSLEPYVLRFNNGTPGHVYGNNGL